MLGATSETDLSQVASDRVIHVQGFRPHYDALSARGGQVVPRITDVAEKPAAAILCLPRAKDAARDLVARATAWNVPVVVDGQKSDGVDSLYAATRKRCDVSPAYSKAHGKLFTLAPGADFSDWALPETRQVADGWHTAPGIFSADGPDPGSVALADALPELKGKIADLGAGWGYLTARALQQSPKIASVQMVEAEHAAVTAARLNVADERVQIDWADATTWRAPHQMDHVISNPPFHTSRKAEPALGMAFITAAKRMLAPSGSLWLVANRHLPYERALQDSFAEVTPLPGPGGYKLIHARKPRRR